MKLRLTAAQVSTCAARIATPANHMECAQLALQSFVVEGHDPFTRRDITAVMNAANWEAPSPEWHAITKWVKDTFPSVGRGLYTQKVGSSGPVEPSPAKGEAPVASEAPEASSATEEVEEKPSEAQEAGPTLTSEWMFQQFGVGLDKKIANILARKFPYENREDLLAECREWMCRWAQQGTCDGHIKAGKPPTVAILSIWVSGKIVHRLHKEGKDALQREIKGVRTHLELNRLKTEGRVEMTQAELTNKAIWVGGDDDDLQREFIAEEEPEDETAHQLEIARDLLRARHPGNPERFGPAFDLLMAGKGAEEAALLEGTSALRITQVWKEIRQDLKGAPVIYQTAKRALAQIMEEPNITEPELHQAFGKETKLAIDFLRLRGLVQEERGSFLLTPKGEGVVTLGALA